MRQLLMLGFYCEVYRREPLCRVYIDEMLVDEFNISRASLEYPWTPDMKLDPSYWTPEDYSMQSNTPFLKFIDFDDAGRKILDIRIEIHNDDNNYANGFMTRYTRVQLCNCYLAPVRVWEEFDQIMYGWKFSRRNWQKYFGHKKITDYYAKSRNVVLDDLTTYADRNFSCVDQPLLKLNCSNDQYLPRMNQLPRNQGWLGTSGYCQLSLAKKLGFWRHSSDRRRGYWKMSAIRNVKGLYDKYRSNEDTRSTN